MTELTTDFVRSCREPGLYWDGHAKAPKGFVFRAYDSGVKAFLIKYYLSGRERQFTIGQWPTWSLSAARERAIELRKLIDQGQDPAGERRERREAPTVQDLIDRYVTDHLPKKANDRRHVVNEHSMLAEIGAHLGKHTKVADVHGGDVAEMHRKITASVSARTGKPRRIQANRIIEVASKMFSLALVPRAGETLPWRDAVSGNPCRGVEHNAEEGRERFFSAAELAAISDALAEYPGDSPDCVRLIMLTGCRPAEAVHATWKEFDEQAGFWIKPAATTKQRKTHRLPLSPAAIELIERLRQKRTGDLVFPGNVAGKPMRSLEHVWNFVRKRTGLGLDARLYDLRHTFASVGAGGGLSLPIIGRLLGHTQPRTTQRYAHLADDPLREAAEKITKIIVGAGRPGAKIVNIK